MHPSVHFSILPFICPESYNGWLGGLGGRTYRQMDRRTDRETNRPIYTQITPVFYRTSSPLDPPPKNKRNQNDLRDLTIAINRSCNCRRSKVKSAFQVSKIQSLFFLRQLLIAEAVTDSVKPDSFARSLTHSLQSSWDKGFYL